MSQKPAERNESIQWLRAIAATEVMIWHSDLVVKGFSNAQIQTSAYAPLGGIGVEVFFIVSGFLMAYVTADRPSARDFMTSRARRIFPLYWAFTLLVILVYLANPKWHLGGFSLDALNVLKSLALWPQNGYPILTVGWTLEHEIVFYGFVATLCALAGRNGAVPRLAFGMLLCALGLAGTLLPDALRAYGLLSHSLSPYMFAFGFGWMLHTWPRVPRTAAIATGMMCGGLFLMAWTLSQGHDLSLIHRMTLAGLLVVAALASRRMLAGAGRAGRLFAALGEASYSVYLSHWIVLSSLGKLVGAAGLPAVLDLPVRVVACLIAMGVGLYLFVLVERPLDRRLRRSSAASRTPRIAMASVFSFVRNRLAAKPLVPGDVVIATERAGSASPGRLRHEGVPSPRI